MLVSNNRIKPDSYFPKSWKLLEKCLLLDCNKSNKAYTSTYFNIAGVNDFGSKPNKFTSGTCCKLIFGTKTTITSYFSFLGDL